MQHLQFLLVLGFCFTMGCQSPKVTTTIIQESSKVDASSVQTTSNFVGTNTTEKNKEERPLFPEIEEKEGVMINYLRAYGEEPEPLSPALEKLGLITFTKTIKPILSKNCASSTCHVHYQGRKPPKLHGDFGKYPYAMSFVKTGKFYKEVIKDKSMPAYGTLSTKEYNLIKAWLATGAQE